jgi:hypothetical protein
MPQQARCYPFDNRHNCRGQMPEDLPSLEPMDPTEDIPNPKGVFPPKQRGTVPFSVQTGSIICQHRPTDEYCLLRGGSLYPWPLPSLLSDPLALPSKECLYTCAFGGFNQTVENHTHIWKAVSNDHRLSNLRTNKNNANGQRSRKWNLGEHGNEYTL